MEELEKPRSKQVITVDHVLEATKGAEALRKRNLVSVSQEDELRRAILEKFRSGVIKNTVAPRKLVRLAQAVSREEVSADSARKVIVKLITKPKYSIDEAFSESVEQVDFEHSVEQLAERLIARIEEHILRGYNLSGTLGETLQRLSKRIKELK
jgi:Asp-tRNA(Asn)/Glu-tRNA(Gln) amidotransferase B subunit